jgi:hypothetical protein
VCRSRSALLLIGLAAALGYACTRVEVTGAPPGPDLGEAGFGGQAEGGAGSLAGEGGEGDGGSRISRGGAPGSIELGLWPTFKAEEGTSDDAGAVLAAIAALSAGSATLPLYERWDTLSGATGSPRAVTWARLDDMIRPYQERSRDVALCIGIVDRSERAWPVLDEVDSVGALLAMERTIDEAFTRYSAQLSHLCFGYEVDRYLASVSEDEGTRLLVLLEHAVSYATLHPMKSPSTAVGVAVTMSAASDPDQLRALALGDEVVAVYDALGSDGDVRAPASIGSELDEVLATLPERGDGTTMPLALFEVGFPSAEAAGSSETDQRAFYEALLEALAERTEHVSFVGLFGLGDRATSTCEEEAMSFGVFQEARATARCSMGLRAEAGTPKSAWPSVVQALSRYQAP